MTPKTEGQRPRLYLVNWSYDHDEQQFDEVICELEGYPGWLIKPDVMVTDNGLLLRRLVIEPEDGVPDGGITTRLLRGLRTGDLIASLRAVRGQARSYGVEGPDLAVGTRVGRRGRDDRYYAEWSAEYVSALDGSTRPVEELARRHSLSSSQVRNLIYACRRRGMLTSAPPGRAGGELTRLAIELLERDA